MNQLVSIITPAYNSSKFIEETIQSVLAQTYTDWELLITDDCSTDITLEIVEKYAAQDSRIKFFVLDQNSGAAAARNNSLARAQGKYIAFLDSDDLWLPQKLAWQLSYMQEHDCAFSFSDYTLMNEDGVDLNKVIHAPKKINYHHYLRNTIIGCLTVMIDKEK
ncbi:MAG TPA: glycosyltransferase, partial [Paludibacteraceae bacterium]|nr:glycosyltransferase [Paludibacteraceae bacterium]